MTTFTRIKEQEYFIKERDESGTGPYQYKVGTKVQFSRYIHRVGYKEHLKSFSMDEWEREYARYLSNKISGVGETDILKVIQKMDFWTPTSLIKDSFVRRNIFDRLRTFSKEPNWRRMWFQNNFDYNRVGGQLVKGKIVGKVRRWTGQYYSASRGYDYWTGEVDYEPAGLYPAFNQNLYLVKSDEVGLNPVIVHPLDIEVTE